MRTCRCTLGAGVARTIAGLSGDADFGAGHVSETTGLRVLVHDTGELLTLPLLRTESI